MLDDLNHLDKWNETVKELQRGWIGKSHGAKITFTLKTPNGDVPLEIFTTRPDTIFGVSFMAIAHDNPLIKNLIRGNRIDENGYERYLETVSLL